jgi:hypothetical protein
MGLRWDWYQSPYVGSGFTSTTVGQGLGLFGINQAPNDLFSTWLQPGNTYLSGYGPNAGVNALQCTTGVVNQPGIPVSHCDPNLLTAIEFVGPNQILTNSLILTTTIIWAGGWLLRTRTGSARTVPQPSVALPLTYEAAAEWWRRRHDARNAPWCSPGFTSQCRHRPVRISITNIWIDGCPETSHQTTMPSARFRYTVPGRSSVRSTRPGYPYTQNQPVGHDKRYTAPHLTCAISPHAPKQQSTANVIHE